MLILALSGCRSRPAPPPAINRVKQVKLAVDSDGIYQVTSDELAAVGFDLASASQSGLKLSTGGQPVAFLLTGGSAGEPLALRFFGQGPGPTDYGAARIYWLAQDTTAGPGLALSGLPTLSAQPPAHLAPSTAATVTLHLEEQRHYIPTVGPDDDPWLWQMLAAADHMELLLPTPHLAPGPGTLQVRVWAKTTAPENPDHHLRLLVNGVMVADEFWDGPGSHVVTAPLPAGLLRSDANRLAIQAPGDTGAAADLVWLDRVELTYPRSLVVDQGMLTFEGDAEGYRLRVAGELAGLWDITEPRRPRELTGYVAQQDTILFAGHGLLRRYIVATREGLRKPAAVLPVTGPDLHAWPGGADMIIITARPFMDALGPLVAARQARGLRVAMVDVQAVYDAFSYGQPGPEAIQTFLHYAQTHWPRPAPRYLLLAGDASYDPRRYLAGPELDWVPTRLIRTAFTGWTASDVWLALPQAVTALGQEAAPAMPQPTPRLDELGLAVGRFPAQTAEQMARMVAKSLAYEASLAQRPAGDRGEWRHRALLLADNDDPGFLAAAQEAAAALEGYTVQLSTLSGDGAEARATLFRSLEQGVGLIGYFGHGSLNLWAEEKLFSSEDAARLQNRERLPIVFTLTCLSGFFQHPTTVSLAESLLRSEGGAVAVLAPSNAGLLEDQRWLAKGLARALSRTMAPAGSDVDSPLTLGEVLLQLREDLLSAPPDQADLSPAQLETFLTFNLLGDPTLLLRY